MEQVGVRKVKAKLSTYLRRVKRGETIVVTERGRPVAELRPHQGPVPDDAERLDETLQRLADEGKLRRPRARLGPMTAWRGWRGVGQRIDSLALLNETREERAWPALRTSKRAR